MPDPIYIMMASMLGITIAMVVVGVLIYKMFGHLETQTKQLSSVINYLGNIAQNTSGKLPAMPTHSVNSERMLNMTNLMERLRRVDPIKSPYEAEQITNQIMLEASELQGDVKEETMQAQITWEMPRRSAI